MKHRVLLPEANSTLFVTATAGNKQHPLSFKSGWVASLVARVCMGSVGVSLGASPLGVATAGNFTVLQYVLGNSVTVTVRTITT